MEAVHLAPDDTETRRDAEAPGRRCPSGGEGATDSVGAAHLNPALRSRGFASGGGEAPRDWGSFGQFSSGSAASGWFTPGEAVGARASLPAHSSPDDAAASRGSVEAGHRASEEADTPRGGADSPSGSAASGRFPSGRAEGSRDAAASEHLSFCAADVPGGSAGAARAASGGAESPSGPVASGRSSSCSKEGSAEPFRP